MFLLVTASAFAHVGMEDPPPRYDSDGFSANKACPCGVGPNNGLCSDPERSDDNRSSNVTVYQSGDTITISAHEVIGHSGRWRVAFDDDGADLDDFNANILLDIADPSGSTGNVGQGDLWEFVVTLPNVSCTNCTLQLIQMMDGNTVDPVPDPTGHSTYYQCADIELVGGPLDTGAEPTDTGTTGTGTGSTGTGSTGTGTGDTDDAGLTLDDSDGGGGCGCSSSPAPAAWLSVGLLWLGRRR